MLWPKMAIFISPKIFKSGSGIRPYRELSNELSYAPLAQCTWPGSPSEQIGALLPPSALYKSGPQTDPTKNDTNSNKCYFLTTF